ncbi:hypothetical protein AEA09_18925 [Lysinibacillus contaminans]|uniref:Uncharacterized protein n=2 Tax=Lysinibacillus contaminans TaxID=1293441 RepID=A0ABR5JWB0_9BACI|nr:hypothetical protein AEA09_18925 [Lysinibacillus contaminans]
MKKRTMLKIVGVFAIIISFMVWDVYENKELKKQEAIAKAEFEKVHTVSDIFDIADSNEKLTSLEILLIASEQLIHVMKTKESILPPKINVTDEKQQKRIIDAINNLQVQKTRDFFGTLETDYTIIINSNEEYILNVSEEKKQIEFVGSNDEFFYQYKILKGDDEFFDALIQQQKTLLK